MAWIALFKIECSDFQIVEWYRAGRRAGLASVALAKDRKKDFDELLLLSSNSSNNNLPSVFIFNQTQRHVERETQSHRSRPTDSGASSCLRISRPIYPPTKPQQRNSGQSKSAKVRGLRRPTLIRHTCARAERRDTRHYYPIWI